MKRRKEDGDRPWNLGGMSATVTAGGENESMGGIDRVNSRQGRETNCLTHSPKARSDGMSEREGREEEGRRANDVTTR